MIQITLVDHGPQAADAIVEDRPIRVGEGSKESWNRCSMVDVGEGTRCVSAGQTISVLQALIEVRHSVATAKSP